VGYRVNFNKKRQALKSLFMWHNELINIWTHLLGALFVLLLIGYVTMNYSQVWKDKTLDEIRGNQSV
jgi:adiponectin receptor